MLKVVSGDLLASKETYLCHQCNCVTNRSAHLARSVFKQFPYSNIYHGRSAPDAPGLVILRGDGTSQRFIANILGQYYPGKSRFQRDMRDGTEARLSYFQKALNHLKSLEGDFAFPWRIGCGAAGGDWDQYYHLLEQFADQIEGDVVIYRLPSQTPPSSLPEQATLF